MKVEDRKKKILRRLVLSRGGVRLSRTHRRRNIAAQLPLSAVGLRPRAASGHLYDFYVYTPYILRCGQRGYGLQTIPDSINGI
jgi:hypothetical protein